MIVLDCESTDSIYSSLEAISGAKRDSIESLLNHISLESLYDSDSPRPRYPANDFVLDAFKKAFRSKLSYDATCWFHLTRTVESARFEDGLRPLGQQLDPIYAFLRSVLGDEVSEQQWSNCRQEISQDASSIYKAKTENPFHWGPYAILLRDLAFKPKEVGNHDYFSGPEIIEDICFYLEEKYRMDALDIFLKKTKPCIVKFIDQDVKNSEFWNKHCLRAALWHLHNIIRKERCSSYCYTCFDGKNAVVPRDRILKVEFPQYPSR